MRGKLLVLADGFASEVDSEFLEDMTVHFGEHDGAVYLCATELRKLLECETAILIGVGEC